MFLLLAQLQNTLKISVLNANVQGSYYFYQLKSNKYVNSIIASILDMDIPGVYYFHDFKCKN